MIKKGLTTITFLFSLLGVILLVIRALKNEDPGGALVATSFYYTTQSNVLVFVTISLFVLGVRKARWFQFLSLITAVDIAVTGIVYHLLLTSYVLDMTFMQHLLHTIVPILYVTFYLLIINTKLTFSNVLIVLLHPILFFLSVHLLVSTLFKDLLRRIYVEYARPEYIYPFLDPNNYEQGIIGSILFATLVLAPSFIVLGIIFIYLDQKISKA